MARIYQLAIIWIRPYSGVLRSRLFRYGDSGFPMNHLSTIIKTDFLTICNNFVPFDLLLSKVNAKPFMVFGSRNIHLLSSYLIIFSLQTFFSCYSYLRMLFVSFNGIILSQSMLPSVRRFLYTCNVLLFQLVTSTLMSQRLADALVEAMFVITTLVEKTVAVQISLTNLSILSL